MDMLDALLYLTVAALGSAINSVAGGGTFITFPALIVSGLSPLAANIVSTIALWPGAVASAFAYRKERVVAARQFWVLLLASVTGGVLGASILLVSPESTFERLVPWLMLIATLLFTFGRRGIARLNLSDTHISHGRLALGFVLQFIIGTYGGYFGAGIGILMLAMLQLMGFTSIHRMNALKTLLGAAINAAAVMIFVFSDEVIWSVALVMVVGAVLGGYAGARLALKVSPEKVRLVVSVIAFGMTGYFFLK